MVYQSFQFLVFVVRGVRKVTTGITDLWKPNVPSNVSFLFFYVGSSYSLCCRSHL